MGYGDSEALETIRPKGPSTAPEDLAYTTPGRLTTSRDDSRQ
jgi:hypothetical protein